MFISTGDEPECFKAPHIEELVAALRGRVQEKLDDERVEEEPIRDPYEEEKRWSGPGAEKKLKAIDFTLRTDDNKTVYVGGYQGPPDE